MLRLVDNSYSFHLAQSPLCYIRSLNKRVVPLQFAAVIIISVPDDRKQVDLCPALILRYVDCDVGSRC